jgi:hypothetical protein
MPFCSEFSADFIGDFCFRQGHGGGFLPGDDFGAVGWSARRPPVRAARALSALVLRPALHLRLHGVRPPTSPAPSHPKKGFTARRKSPIQTWMQIQESQNGKIEKMLLDPKYSQPHCEWLRLCVFERLPVVLALHARNLHGSLALEWFSLLLWQPQAIPQLLCANWPMLLQEFAHRRRNLATHTEQQYTLDPRCSK